jgi:hypothetical protein
MGMSATYVTLEASRSKAETMSVVDLIRAAEKRQRQLLSLTYCYPDGQGRLHLFIYNYGEETSTPNIVIVGQNVYYKDVNMTSIIMKNMDTGVPCSDIPPKMLVELTVPAPAFDFVMLTVEGGIFSWKLNV